MITSSELTDFLIVGGFSALNPDIIDMRAFKKMLKAKVKVAYSPVKDEIDKLFTCLYEEEVKCCGSVQKAIESLEQAHISEICDESLFDSMAYQLTPAINGQDDNYLEYYGKEWEWFINELREGLIEYMWDEWLDDKR